MLKNLIDKKSKENEDWENKYNETASDFKNLHSTKNELEMVYFFYIKFINFRNALD